MSRAITLEPGSLSDRVCRWFAMSSNRGEERIPALLATFELRGLTRTRGKST